jgi:hypothetical protein
VCACVVDTGAEMEVGGWLCRVKLLLFAEPSSREIVNELELRASTWAGQVEAGEASPHWEKPRVEQQLRPR